jgi:periplasmic protein TonB
MNQAVLTLNEPISPPRVGGVAAAIAIHIVAFMLLMVPLSYAPPIEIPDTIIYEDPAVRVITETIKVPEEVKPEKKPQIVPIVTNKTVTPPQPTPEVIYNNAGPNDLPTADPIPNQGPTELPYVAPPSGPISLSTLFAPAPRYPTTSLRNGEEGVVILLVRVDAAGLPVDISIQKSSGHRELDRAAKKHVLDTWRFHPAMHQGSAIPALALVPVEFKING